MFNRLSVNGLLKSAIAALSLVIMAMLAFGAWSSWTRLASVNRIAAVANVSSDLFTALHNLRVDRSNTNRDLLADQPLTTPNPQLREIRAAQMPALKSALTALPAIDFQDRAALVGSLDQAYRRLTALHEESLAAVMQPKAARRASLAPEFFKETSDLIALLDKLMSALTRSIKLEDAYIDHLMELKQLAWMARNSAGDASVLITNLVAGLAQPGDPMITYTGYVNKLAANWAALEDLAGSMPMPAKFSEAMAKANNGFLARDFEELRMKTLKAVLAGQPSGTTPREWSILGVAKLATILSAAEAALDVAKDHSAAQRASATWAFGAQIGLLAAAFLVAIGMMWWLSRRVTGPLDVIQHAMLKLAGGDLTGGSRRSPAARTRSARSRAPCRPSRPA